MDKQAIYKLANNIAEKDNIGAAAAHIKMCCNSTSIDKFIIKHNETSIKKDLNKIKESLYKINEYAKELEAHIYDGELNDKDQQLASE